jgi:hypothetical protein
MFLRKHVETKPADPAAPRTNKLLGVVGGSSTRKSVQAIVKGRIHVKSILKVKSVDESLHSSYGESKESEEGLTKKRAIEFTDILIREYARTIGDNPSCSSGPPVAYVVAFVVVS